MTTRPPLKLPGTPKPWMNTAMRTAMSLPIVRRILGKTFAIITVTGARTGREYSTPVQFVKIGDDHVVLSQIHRRWWRNIRNRPDVVLTIAGKAMPGQGVVPTGDDARQILAEVMAGNVRAAKFYGIQLDEDGAIDPVDVERLAEAFVPIVITIDRSV